MTPERRLISRSCVPQALALLCAWFLAGGPVPAGAPALLAAEAAAPPGSDQAGTPKAGTQNAAASAPAPQAAVFEPRIAVPACVRNSTLSPSGCIL